MTSERTLPRRTPIGEFVIDGILWVYYKTLALKIRILKTDAYIDAARWLDSCSPVNGFQEIVGARAA